jgi:hypothetical protein
MSTAASNEHPGAVGDDRSTGDAPLTPLTNVPAKPAEVLIHEARRRQRRRGGFILLATAAAVAAGLTVTLDSPPHHPSPSVAGAGKGVSAEAPTPDYLVVHGPTATARPGAVQVFNAKTGEAVRTLGTSYAQQGTGFQVTASERTLYYERLDTTGPHHQIVAQPLDGGPPRAVGYGDGFSVSANGKLLAITSGTNAGGGTPPALPALRITNPATGRLVASTRLPDHGAGSSMAWVAGEPELLVLVGAPSVALLLHLHGHKIRVTKVPTSRSLPLGPIGWTTVGLLGPGPTKGTVVATSRFGPFETMIVRAATGVVLRRHALPSLPGDRGVNIRGVDASGQHFLLAATGPTPTMRLWEWTPPSLDLRLVGPADIEATW